MSEAGFSFLPKSPLIDYRIRWKPAGHQPGAMHGSEAGVGDQLRSLVLLRDHPDPRRLDLRMSLRDPFSRLWVRDFNLNAALKVIVLVDASASMAYQGTVSRRQVVHNIVAQLALSAYRSGDAFGVYTANKNSIHNGCLPTKINRGAFAWVYRQFSKIKAEGNSSQGLLKIANQLPQKQSLVFVISDFRWPNGQLKQLLKQLNHHDVIPVMLQDSAEIDAFPRRGIVLLRDVETAKTKFVWMRDSLRLKIQAAREQHIQQVNQLCAAHACKPFVVKGNFEASQMTRYFMERVAV